MSNEPITGLQYTGHPLIDVGIATIIAFAHKDSPDELTPADLESIADYMAQNYIKNPLRSYLTVVFPNSGFTQSAYFDKPADTPEKRQENRQKIQTYIDRVIYAYRQEPSDKELADAFLGLPVADVPFDVKSELIPGRAFRQHIPLQTGEDVINFHPYGHAGLPISGLTLLAIHAYPLGSAKSAGRTLAVHSDNPEIMRYFAATFLKENLLQINLAQQANSPKLPEHPQKYRTLLIEILLDATRKQQTSQRQHEPFSITAYHLTNSGQGADLNIYHLPAQIISYLQLMLSPDYQKAWEQIVRQAWIKPKLKRGQTDTPADFVPDRNYLYEDLFRLADDVAGQAPRFIRTYFLRAPFRYARQNETDPRGQYHTPQQLTLVSWKLTEPFLRRILHMDEVRITQIRQLGDQLAAYVKKQNDKRFFRNFYLEGKYPSFRALLLKANTGHVQRGHPPILTLDTYTTVFEDGEELGKSNWTLARDLVLIRMIEQLYAGDNWFRQNEDAFPEIIEQSETQQEDLS